MARAIEKVIVYRSTVHDEALPGLGSAVVDLRDDVADATGFSAQTKEGLNFLLLLACSLHVDRIRVHARRAFVRDYRLFFGDHETERDIDFDDGGHHLSQA